MKVFRLHFRPSPPLSMFIESFLLSKQVNSGNLAPGLSTTLSWRLWRWERSANRTPELSQAYDRWICCSVFKQGTAITPGFWGRFQGLLLVSPLWMDLHEFIVHNPLKLPWHAWQVRKFTTMFWLRQVYQQAWRCDGYDRKIMHRELERRRKPLGFRKGAALYCIPSWLSWWCKVQVIHFTGREICLADLLF